MNIRVIAIISCLLPIWMTAQTHTEDTLQKIANVINSIKKQEFTANEQETMDKLTEWRTKLSKDETIIGNYSISHMARIISIPHKPWGQILLKLTNEFQSKMMLEIGTCIGMSAAYLAAGAPQGKMLTYENFAPIVPLAEDTLSYAGVSNVEILLGDVATLLKNTVSKVDPIDFVFDDHIHTERPVLEYFNIISPYLADQAVYLFDDIMRNPSMESAWNKIKNDPRVSIGVTLTQGICYHDFDHAVPRLGICIIDNKIKEKYYIDINLDRCNNVSVQNNQLILN
ncbi:MAG: O-methyltransferase [Candidatus Babeliales bacterium]